MTETPLLLGKYPSPRDNPQARPKPVCDNASEYFWKQLISSRSSALYIRRMIVGDLGSPDDAYEAIVVQKLPSFHLETALVTTGSLAGALVIPPRSHKLWAMAQKRYILPGNISTLPYAVAMRNIFTPEISDKAILSCRDDVVKAMKDSQSDARSDFYTTLYERTFRLEKFEKFIRTELTLLAISLLGIPADEAMFWQNVEEYSTFIERQ